jgi:hypothetical protein
MADERAFALKESAQDLVALGVHVNGEPVDVKELLDNGDGVLVTGDQPLIDALELVEQLKSVPVPAAKPKPKSKSTAKSGGKE